MGKTHRKLRSICKRLLLRSGLRETELGELKPTKAAARRQFMAALVIRLRAEVAIVRAAHQKAVEDMQSIEDAIFTRELEQSIQELA